MDISIILPTYNGATRGEGKYLKQAIESVLSQTYENFELIVVNDGSTDNTEEIIEQYKDERIIYLKHDINKGHSAARNTGLKIATGDYVCFLDDDDFFYKNKIEVQLKWMVKANASISVCDGDVIDNNGIKIGLLKNIGNKPYIKDICCFNINGYSSSIMVNRKVIDFGYYFKEYLTAHVDWDFLLRVTLDFDLFLVPYVLFAYRRHTLNLTLNLENIYINSSFIRFNLKKYIVPYYIHNDNSYFFDHFYICLKSSYYNNNFKFFRHMVKITKLYGKLSSIWIMKYYLSYFPFIVPFLKKIRSLCKKKHA